MPANDSPSVSVTRRGPTCLGSDPLRTVVCVRGEHDIATRLLLSVTLDEAAHLDDADIVVDLSGVTFMDASTIGALVVARNHLRALSRSLSVRDPSPPARRLLGLCGLARLIDDDPARPPVGTALGTWVSVPARERGRDAAQQQITPKAPLQEPACATVGQRRRGQTAALRRRHRRQRPDAMNEMRIQ